MVVGYDVAIGADNYSGTRTLNDSWLPLGRLAKPEEEVQKWINRLALFYRSFDVHHGMDCLFGCRTEVGRGDQCRMVGDEASVGR